MQTLFSRHQHQLASLMEQWQHRQSLRQRLCACLSPKAQQALLDAYVKDHCLHLLTSNASWASRFRLSARQLIQACADPDIHQLSVHIAAQVTEINPTRTQKERLKPCLQTLDQLSTLSKQLNPDEPLAQALQRLIQQVSSAPHHEET